MSLDNVSSTSHEQPGQRLKLGRWAAKLLERAVPSLDAGSLVVHLPNGSHVELRGRTEGPQAVVSIARWRCLSRLLRAGDLGFADSYIDGDWTTPDLARLFEWAMANQKSLVRSFTGSSVFSQMARRFAHRTRANTKRGSRRNIAAHYDLGNTFYSAWLDRGMNYSSAIYSDAARTLEQAQENKVTRAVSMLDLKGGESVMEIGFGWGSVLERLIGQYRCAVTGLTLSKEQLAYARQRLADLVPQPNLRMQDYRDERGQFDRIISIEMIEAVGEKYWPVYFGKLRECLKAGGVCVLQAITIAESRFDYYRRNPDFIQHYIFPGGMLPTKTHLRERAAAAGLTLVEQDCFGQSYARTLAEWRKRFLAAWPGIEALGFEGRFRRMWEYYLAYCEVGFRTAVIDVGLYKLQG